MNKNLVARCLSEEGFKMITFGDDEFFNTKDLELYIREIVFGRDYSFKQESIEEEVLHFQNEENSDSVFDDDIPF